MNEQLIVKNFGPIKDATVDFKRVTVFIGPTGGGKSTLAKLKDIFQTVDFWGGTLRNRQKHFERYSIDKFIQLISSFIWSNDERHYKISGDFTQYELNKDGVIINEIPNQQNAPEHIRKTDGLSLNEADLEELKTILSRNGYNNEQWPALRQSVLDTLFGIGYTIGSPSFYFPSSRTFIPSVEYSWAGFIRDDIGLPKEILEFANSFSQARPEVVELEIPFLGAKYVHQNGQDFIKIPESETLFRLYETASGIQSVTPLLVLLEHLSRNTEQAQSFIVEEPELNLFPLAQFELAKILVEKCAQLEGKNDLVITTHSPYILTALNLLCYAYRIAQQDEATAKKVAKLIPRHCWIAPNQFAAYYVDRPDTKRKQQVRSIINKKTGLIEENELDTASDELGAIFDKLVRMRKPTQTPSRAS